jgi:hypothetical protein
VYGTLSVTSPAITPYKYVCRQCNLSNLIIVEEGFYCNVCHSPQQVLKQAYLRGKITTTSQAVTMYLEGKWLQTLVRMLEEQFLNLSRGEQVKVFTTFRIKGTFWLIPMSILNGFDEDMETSSMPISCNVDSNPVPSTTLDSFVGSEVQACTPPFPLKRKLDDSVDASPGSTTTSKSRKLLENDRDRIGFKYTSICQGGLLLNKVYILNSKGHASTSFLYFYKLYYYKLYFYKLYCLKLHSYKLYCLKLYY